jgi:hypothetical protein
MADRPSLDELKSETLRGIIVPPFPTRQRRRAEALTKAAMATPHSLQTGEPNAL